MSLRYFRKYCWLRSDPQDQDAQNTTSDTANGREALIHEGCEAQDNVQESSRDEVSSQVAENVGEDADLIET